MKIFTILIASLGIFSGSIANAQAPYSLPKLNYEYKALEPYIDAQTMEIHYTKHHQAYVTNLNKALTGQKYENATLDQLLLNAGKLGDAVRNNAGGHYNHSLFWEILTPKKDTKMSDELKNAIIANFTSMDSLKTLLNQAATARFGSGWAWLVVTPDKKLAVSSTPNQDNPIMDVATVRGIPVLGIDVWEHAYYLHYQNKRADYLGAIWNVLNWEAISENYTKALTNPLLKTIEKSKWTELNEFHQVMAATFHPAEKKDFAPVRSRSNELCEKADNLKNSKIPASFDTPEIRKSLENLTKETKELNKMNRKKASDVQLMAQLEKVHNAFHEIQGLCEGH